MKFLLDESADFPLASYLQEASHDVTAIAHDYPHVLKDEEVLKIAVKEKRVLITNDRDFGELIFRQKLRHSGVILFRLGKEDIATKKSWLKTVLANHLNSLKNFIVITDHGIRVRKTFPSS